MGYFEEEISEHHLKIKREFLANELPRIKCHWYTTWEEIENSPVESWRLPEYGRFWLYTQNNVKKLIDAISSRRLNT